MAKILLPSNFASISMRERYDIMLKEFYKEYSIIKLVDATFEKVKTDLDAEHAITDPVESFIPIMKEKILEICVNLMSDWVKSEVFEDAAEIEMYFPQAVLSTEQLNAVNFITVCGPAVHAFVKFALRDKYFNKYINRPEVKQHLIEQHGLDVTTL